MKHVKQSSKIKAMLTHYVLRALQFANWLVVDMMR